MSGIDYNAVQNRYKTLDSDALIKIAFLEPENYVEDAIGLAKLELASRGVTENSHEELTKVKAEALHEADVQNDKSSKPADPIVLTICFIFSISFVTITMGGIVALVYAGNGRKKAAVSVVKAIVLGVAFKLIFGAILSKLI